MSSAKSGRRKLLPKSKFVRGVSVLVGGTAGAQLLMVLASPFLTRFYSPDDFGLLAVYAGLLSVISVISGLRYELAIPLPENDRDAVSVAVLTLLAVMVTTLLTALVIWLLGEQIADALGVPELASIFWLLPLGVLLQGIYKAFNYWAIRVKQFSAIARTRLVQSTAMLAIQLLGHKAGGVSLVSGHTIGQGAGSLSLARSALSRPEFRQWTWPDLWRSAKRYREFPLFSTWSGFFNTAGQQLPPLMFAAFFSAGAAGFYALAHRVLAMPITVLGQAVANVFFPDAAEAYRDGRIAPLVRTVHDKLAKIAMPPMLALVIVGPDFFALAFGAEWRTAGEFARWMAPWLYLVFVTSPLSLLFSVLEKQKQAMLFQLIVLIARVAAISIGARYGDIYIAVILFAVANFICRGIFLLWIASIAGNSMAVICKSTSRALGAAVIFVTPLIIAKVCSVNDPMWWALSVCSLGFILVYYWSLFSKTST